MGRTPAVLLVAPAATLEECAQLLAPVRTFEWLDLGANLAGVLFFSWAAEFLVQERLRHPTFAAFVRRSLRDLRVFAGKLLLALIFPLAIFAALAITREMAFPLLGLHRYDFLLLLFLGMQALLVATGLESPAELRIITLFHLLGLALELFKVSAGSWSYPEPAWSKVAGVPLYSGFMYASVASFLIQIWHRLQVRLEGWPRRALVAGLGIVGLSGPAGGLADGPPGQDQLLVPARHHQLHPGRSRQSEHTRRRRCRLPREGLASYRTGSRGPRRPPDKPIAPA